MARKKTIARSVKAATKNIIASNPVFANLYFAFFKEQISIAVKDKTISYYQNEQLSPVILIMLTVCVLKLAHINRI